MRFWAACDLGVAVDRDVSNIGQNLGSTIAPLVEIEQFRRRVDERRRVFVGQKGLVL